VFVTVFDDESRAAAAERDIAASEEEGLIVLLAAAVISRDRAGEASWSVRGLSAGHLAARADIIATMLGVALPPRVVAAGLMAASVDGAGAEPEREFNELFMREVSTGIEPGSSVFIAVIDDRWAAEMERGLRGYHRLTRRHP
jgi:uncharacterized membrane protein